MAAEMETDEFSDDLAKLGSGAPACATRQLKEVLQQVERQVSVLMKDARRVTQERDSLLETLYILQNDEHIQTLSANDQETIGATCEALVAQCLSVEVNIDPGREPDQELALHMVNNWIDKLILTARHNPVEARSRCEIYVQTLGGDGEHDSTFHALVTNCSASDRDTVGDRLAGLLKYIDYILGRPSELE